MIMTKKGKTSIKQIILVLIAFNGTGTLISNPRDQSVSPAVIIDVLQLHNQEELRLQNLIQQNQTDHETNYTLREYPEIDQQILINRPFIEAQAENEGCGCAQIAGFTVCLAYMAIPICFIVSWAIAGF